MKIIQHSSLLVILTIVFISSAKAQNDPPEILQIRKDYAAIENNIGSYQMDHLSGWYIDGMNMEIDVYRDKTTNDVVKIVVEAIADWHDFTSSYYLKNEQIFFVFTTGSSGEDFKSFEEMGFTETMNVDAGMRDPRILEFFEYRKYFSNSVMIRNLIKSKKYEYSNSFDRNIVDLSKEPNVPQDISSSDFKYYTEFVEMVLEEFRK